MTSFSTLEASVESSRPIELYEFALGSEMYRYTSAEDTVTIGSDDYTPIAIARNHVEQGADQATRTLMITMPANNPFASQYVNVVPGERASVNVYRYQRDESPSFATQVLLFKGLVQSVRFPEDGTVAEIAVRSIESALNRNVPRFSYMGMCNHFLYDASCGVNPSSYNHIGAVTLVSGNQVTVTGAGASGFDFVGGYARPTGSNDFRMVLAQSGDVLTLLLPFADSIVGSDLQVFAGCDHLVGGDCALVFDNVINFGGFGFVPNRNVFQTGLD
jgi:uncharacterized phage protein (TIGR02218 family)